MTLLGVTLADQDRDCDRGCPGCFLVRGTPSGRRGAAELGAARGIRPAVDALGAALAAGPCGFSRLGGVVNRGTAATVLEALGGLLVHARRAGLSTELIVDPERLGEVLRAPWRTALDTVATSLGLYGGGATGTERLRRDLHRLRRAGLASYVLATLLTPAAARRMLVSTVPGLLASGVAVHVVTPRPRPPGWPGLLPELLERLLPLAERHHFVAEPLLTLDGPLLASMGLAGGAPHPRLHLRARAVELRRCTYAPEPDAHLIGDPAATLRPALARIAVTSGAPCACERDAIGPAGVPG